MTSLSPERQRLLDEARLARNDRSTFQQGFDSALAELQERRGKVARHFRQGIIDKAFAAAGIDQAEIAKRQKAESESLRLDLEHLRPSLEAQSDKVHLRHLAEVERKKQLFLRKPAPGAGPFPFDVFALTTADAVDLSDNGIGTITSTAPWQNTLKTKLSTNPDFPRCVADFSFFWMPQRSGVLRAISWIAANGSAEWFMDSNCWDSTSITMSAGATMVLQQFDFAGNLNSSFPAGASVFSRYVHHAQTDYCLGDVGAASIDNLQSVESAPASAYGPGFPIDFPVIGNAEVLITVTTTAQINRSNSAGVLDFLTGNRQLSVLGVILNFY